MEMIIPKAKRLEHVQEYYFARKLAEVNALVASGRSIINLGIGDPDLQPSPATINALTSNAAMAGAHGYQPYRALPALRQAMEEWYNATYQVLLSPDQEVLPLMGSKEGIFHISMAFLNHGDKVLVPNPGYPAYASAARLAGAEPVCYHLSEENDWLPDKKELMALAAEGVKLMWINYPHMPSGAAATEEALQWLVEFVRANKILLVNDNPYSLVLPDSTPLSLLRIAGSETCCLELNSLSKSHNMAGWRVGMALGHKAYIAAILAVKSNMDSGMFKPIQEAAIQALQNDSQWHEERNRIYAERRHLVYQLLDLLECTYQKNTAGLFVWARVPDHIPEVEAYLDELLYEAGIFLTPGKIFGNQGNRYLRVSLCLPTGTLSEAIKRIKEHTKLSICHELD